MSRNVSLENRDRLIELGVEIAALRGHQSEHPRPDRSAQRRPAFFC